MFEMYIILRNMELLLMLLPYILWAVYIKGKVKYRKLRVHVVAGFLGIFWFMLFKLWIPVLILLCITFIDFIFESIVFQIVNYIIYQPVASDYSFLSIFNIVYTGVKIIVPIGFMMIFARTLYFLKYKSEVDGSTPSDERYRRSAINGSLFQSKRNNATLEHTPRK